MTVTAEIGKRLRSFRLDKKLTQTALAKAAGRSKQLVSAWEAGRAEITVESVTRLARTVGLDPRWLLMGDRLAGTEPPRDAIIGTRIPLRSIEQIASSRTADAAHQISGKVVTTYHDYPAGCFAMPCPEGLLIPYIAANDLLIIDPAAPARPGQLVAATIIAENDIKLHEPAVVLRRLHFQSIRGLDGPVALLPEAPGWPTLVVRLGTDARLIGTVVGFDGRIGPGDRAFAHPCR